MVAKQTVIANLPLDNQRTNTLKHTEALFSGLLESAPDAIVITDAEGRVILANKRLEQLFGYQREELIGQAIEILIPTAARASHIALRNDYTTRPETRPMGQHSVLLARKKDGSSFPVEISLSPHNTSTGILVTAIVRDITKRIEEKREQQRLASIPLHSPIPIVEIDTDYAVSYSNAAARKLFPELVERGLEHPLLIELRMIRKHFRDGNNSPVIRQLEIDGSVYQQHITYVTDIDVLHIYTLDITAIHKMAQELEHQARHDALTGLVNRQEFETRLRHAITNIPVDKGHALLYLDLDQFKVVNDTCGHSAGDKLLKQLTYLLQGKVRGSDTLARLGGDEFGVLLERCPLERAIEIAERLRQTVAEFRFSWEGKNFDIGVSIGLVAIEGTGNNLAEIMSAADSACYVAKDQGRNRVHIYAADDSALANHKGLMQWVPRIRQALEENRFQLYFQTILPLSPQQNKTNKCYETLIRMVGEEGEIIAPMAFIPSAERYNLMTTLDRWVVRNTLILLTTRATDITLCTINLSGQSICEKGFMEFVVDEIKQSGIDARRLCFEITETAAIANLSEATRFIYRLKELECRFALDDFGSGFSSFAYLKNLPVDFLKIYGGFVRDMVHDAVDCTMVKSINQIAHAMEIQTIAEFVEDDITLEQLTKIGVNYAQGYGIDKPGPYPAIEEHTFPHDRDEQKFL
ncbi:MAG TPA: EAL domain-containing protein [Gammaproteobacteria bacterium]|nr:EAL domain-containing protein [Gammaproteobacteria bacterium]